MTSETSSQWTLAIYQGLAWHQAPTPGHPGWSSGELIINYLIMYLCCQNNCELWYFISRSNDKVTEHTRVEWDEGRRGFNDIITLSEVLGCVQSVYLPEVWEKVQTINHKSKKRFYHICDKRYLKVTPRDAPRDEQRSARLFSLTEGQIFSLFTLASNNNK